MTTTCPTRWPCACAAAGMARAATPATAASASRDDMNLMFSLPVRNLADVTPSRSDAVDGQQSLLVLCRDLRDDLNVILEPRAAQLAGQQLVDLEDAGRVVHLDLDPDRALLALEDPDLVDRGRRERVDVRQLRLEGDARAAVLHVERVGDADDPGLERERRAAAAVADH